MRVHVERGRYAEKAITRVWVWTRKGLRVYSRKTFTYPFRVRRERGKR